MEYTIVQRSQYDFDVYEHFTNSMVNYLGKYSSVQIADKVCYDRMNDIKRYGKISKLLISK